MVIASQKETERWKCQYGLADDVRSMKEKLERKLNEVSSLVDEIGGLPEKAAKKERRRKSTHLADADWRNRRHLAAVSSGLLAEQEGRLPPIVEDKLYPRRTLEPLEIQNLVHAEGNTNESESPDLGPPPIAHFDVADPIDFKPHKQPKNESPEAGDEDVVQLPSNLETRRKRRTSSLLRDMTAEEAMSESEDKDKPSLFKSGAKRKLDVSELYDNAPQATSESEAEDFVFQRRAALKAASNRKSSRFSRPNPGEIVIPATDAASPQKGGREIERRALAPKSTNSPSKKRVQEVGKPDLKKHDVPKRSVRIEEPFNNNERPSSRRGPNLPKPTPKAQPESLPTKEPESEPPSEHPPTTPFLPSDMLSPTSSEPFTSAPSSTRGPSEAAIINSVEDVLNGSIGRASRRAKATVSYAQPNLRDKMRRPGREMVGAVEGLKGGKREGSIGSVLSRSTSEDPDLAIKREESEERWRTLPLANGKGGREKEEPGSPLGDKKAPIAATEKEPERDRASAIRRHAQARREQKALLDADQDNPEEEKLRKAVERLSIFDGPASSPTNGEPDRHTGKTTKDTRPSSSNSEISAATKRKVNASVGVIGREAGRRHSMAPATNGNPTRDRNAPLDPSKVLSNLSKSTSMSSRDKEKASAALARPASATALRGGGERTAESGGLKRTASVSLLKQQQQRGQAHSQDQDDGLEGRSERVATRRRSMMV